MLSLCLAQSLISPAASHENMKRELEGTVTRSQGQVAIKDSEGKERLVHNLFDGLSGKKVRVTVELLEE